MKFNKKHRKNLSIARTNGYLDKIENNKKLCPKCNQIFSLSNFHKDLRRTNKYQLWCKQCGLNAKNEHYKNMNIIRKNRYSEGIRNSALKHNYGITLIEYNKILEKQNGVCAICNKPETQHSYPTGKVDSLRVDHNHKTNKIRGLLCSKCNFGISQFNDNIKLMRIAINYLRTGEIK